MPVAQVADVLTFLPSKLQGDISRCLTAHLIAAQEDGGRLEVATAGKPQTWIKISKGQTSSSQATERTLRQRSTEMEQLWDVVSASSYAAHQADA